MGLASPDDMVTAESAGKLVAEVRCYPLGAFAVLVLVMQA
jgi:hypothetical protein